MKTSKIKKRISRGMSLIEYAMLVAVLAVAVIGMQIYLKRAVSGKWKQSIDIFGYGRQYEPRLTGN